MKTQDQYRDFKAKFKISFEEEKYFYNLKSGLCLLAQSGDLLIRHAIFRNNGRIYKKDKSILLDWWNRRILNYDDLTPRQKRNLEKAKPLDHCGSAIVKNIRMREYDTDTDFHYITNKVIVNLPQSKDK